MQQQIGDLGVRGAMKVFEVDCLLVPGPMVPHTYPQERSLWDRVFSLTPWEPARMVTTMVNSWEPDPDVYAIGDELFAHPKTARRLQEVLRGRVKDLGSCFNAKELQRELKLQAELLKMETEGLPHA